jgi:HdeA/HdeB family
MKMRIASIVTAAAISTMAGIAWAAIGLDTYVDQSGFIDVQELTCAQLADTYQEDANALANWYSGWYNGLAKKHYYHLTRVAGVEHQLIAYCKEHRDQKIIHGLDAVFKKDRDSH